MQRRRSQGIDFFFDLVYNIDKLSLGTVLEFGALKTCPPLILDRIFQLYRGKSLV